MRLGTWLILGIALLAVGGCRGRVEQPNEENPYYQSGVELREQGNYAQAVKAFESCLRFSPESEKAHLQIAILCEDNLNDLPRAITHYQAYLQMEKDETRLDPARTWLARAEQKYYQQLRAKYGKADETPVATTKAPEPAGTVSPDAGSVSSPVSVTPPPPGGPAHAVGTSYTVRKGDTLRSIARHVYGREGEWSRIFEANREQLKTPEQVRVGQQLRLPPAPATP